ncbi:putative addiction module antidote protein [Kaistia algarum]|uniref:addiction module antidote protein n=1 Tax=Kaistia algarum TaxID=2083279 RepID=UPI000CE8CDD9|nr:addiction module antidote protein [Kaistia algarum]MCX5516113.1 putative addiction module antidote protein [Kaistia algarum]PPE78189.1 putative addiction module antidote protein [Kaistia algarum]
MALSITKWDVAEHLDNDERIALFLEAIFEDGTPSEIAEALGVVARARGMTQLAAQTGLSRPALYKALSGDGNPGLDTIMKVLAALGMRLAVAPLPDKAA